jgi:hypothetical protein
MTRDEPAPVKTPVDIERYIDAVAPAVGMAIPDEYRADAATYLKLAFAVAEPLLAFELDETIEPAPIFRP